MKRLARVLSFVVSVITLAGCAGGSNIVNSDPTQQVGLEVKDERILTGPACSVDDPAVCPEGTTCASLDLAAGRRSICVDPKAVCEQLACASGQCVTLESYPIQVRCAQ
jgi:hypothetical protein